MFQTIEGDGEKSTEITRLLGNRRKEHSLFDNYFYLDEKSRLKNVVPESELNTPVHRTCGEKKALTKILVALGDVRILRTRSRILS